MAKKSSGATFADIMSKYNASNVDNAEKTSTGLRCLDKLLGGGTAKGYCYCMYGEPGAGKSTLTFQTMKSYLKKGKKVMFLDVEKSLNDVQLECFGLTEFVESGQLIHLIIGNVSEFDDVISAIISEEGAGIDLLVVDSTTMIREVAKDDLRVEDVRPGLHSRQMSFLLNKLKDGFYRCGVTTILISQARANIDISGPAAYSAPAYKQAGGYSERHIPDVVIKVEAGAIIRDKDKVIRGNRVRISTEKNKFAPPKIVIERDLIFGKGISKRQEVIEDAIDQGVISMAGAGFYTLPNGEKCRGMEALLDLDTSILSEIQSMLR